jgi:hypothetical protein
MSSEVKTGLRRIAIVVAGAGSIAAAYMRHRFADLHPTALLVACLALLCCSVLLLRIDRDEHARRRR